MATQMNLKKLNDYGKFLKDLIHKNEQRFCNLLLVI